MENHHHPIPHSNIIIMDMENRRNADVEDSMLHSPQFSTPSKKPGKSRQPRNFCLGFKLSNFILTVAIGIIIIIEIKIMYETTRTYNESLVSQLSQKNENLQRALLNLTSTHKDRNELLEKLIQINEEARNDAENRTGALEDKMDETQNLIVQLTKENKAMYANGEKNFMETLKLVREALTMNTNTVIRLSEENNEIQTKLHNLEESVNMASVVRQRSRWDKDSDLYGSSIATKIPSSSLITAFGFVIFVYIFTI